MHQVDFTWQRFITSSRATAFCGSLPSVSCEMCPTAFSARGQYQSTGSAMPCCRARWKMLRRMISRSSSLIGSRNTGPSSGGIGVRSRCQSSTRPSSAFSMPSFTGAEPSGAGLPSCSTRQRLAGCGRWRRSGRAPAAWPGLCRSGSPGWRCPWRRRLPDSTFRQRGAEPGFTA